MGEDEKQDTNQDSTAETKPATPPIPPPLPLEDVKKSNSGNSSPLADSD